jgi:hypothetical protein
MLKKNSNLVQLKKGYIMYFKYIIVALVLFSCQRNNEITQENVNDYIEFNYNKFKESSSSLFPIQNYFLAIDKQPKELNDYSNAIIQRYYGNLSVLEFELEKTNDFTLNDSSKEIIESVKRDKKNIQFINENWYRFNFLSPFTGGHLEILFALENYPMITSEVEFKRILVLIEDAKRKLRSLKNRIELRNEKNLKFSSYSASIISDSFETIEKNFKSHVEKILQRIEKSKFTESEYKKMAEDLSYYMDKFYLKYLVKLGDEFKEAKKENLSFDKSFLEGLGSVYSSTNFKADSTDKALSKINELLAIEFDYNKNYLIVMTGLNLALIKKLRFLFQEKEKQRFLASIEKEFLNGQIKYDELQSRLEKELKIPEERAIVLIQIMEIHPMIFSTVAI